MAICSLIKEVALLLYVIGISQAERDLLDSIHLNGENPPEVNDFLHTVLQYKDDFRWIRKLARHSDASSHSKKSAYIPPHVEFLKRDASNTNHRPINDVNPYIYELDESIQPRKVIYRDRPARNLRRKRKRHKIGVVRYKRSKGSINLDLSNEQDTGEVKIVPRSETGVQNVPGQKYFGRHRKSATSTDTCNVPDHVQHDVVWKNTSKYQNESKEAGEYYFTSPHDLLGLSQDIGANDDLKNRTCVQSTKVQVSRNSRNVTNTANSGLVQPQIKSLNIAAAPTLAPSSSIKLTTSPGLAAVSPQFTLVPPRQIVQTAFFPQPVQIAASMSGLPAPTGIATLPPLDSFPAMPTLRSTTTLPPFAERQFVEDPRNSDFIKLVHYIETPNRDQVPSSKQELLRKDNDDLLENIDHVLKADRSGLHMYRGMNEQQQTTRKKGEYELIISTEKDPPFGMFKSLENHPMLHNLLGSRRILPMKVAYSIPGTNKKIRSVNKQDFETSATEEEDDDHFPDVELKFNSHPIQKFKGKKPTNRRRITIGRKKKKKSDRHYPYTTTELTTSTTTVILPSSGLMFTISPTDNSVVNNPNIKLLENADDDNNKNLKMTLKEYLNRENAYNLEKQQQDDEEEENAFDYNVGQQKKIELEDLTEPTSAAEQRELGRKDEPATPTIGNEDSDNQFIVIPLKKQTSGESIGYRSADYEPVHTAEGFKVKDSEDVIHLGKQESLAKEFKKNSNAVEISTDKEPVQKRNLLQKGNRNTITEESLSILNLENDDYAYNSNEGKLNPMKLSLDYNYYDNLEQKREIPQNDVTRFKGRKLHDFNHNYYDVHYMEKKLNPQLIPEYVFDTPYEHLNLKKRSEDDEPDEEPGNDAKEPHYKQKKVEENEPLDLSPKVEETETLHMDVIDPKRRSYADSFDYSANDENEVSNKKDNDRSVKDNEKPTIKKYGRANFLNGTNTTGAIAISITTIDDFQLNSDDDKLERTTNRRSTHFHSKNEDEYYRSEDKSSTETTPLLRKKTTRGTTETTCRRDEMDDDDSSCSEKTTEETECTEEPANDQTTCILISAKPLNISTSELEKYRHKSLDRITTDVDESRDDNERLSTKKLTLSKKLKKPVTTECYEAVKQCGKESDEEDKAKEKIKEEECVTTTTEVTDQCKEEAKEDAKEESCKEETEEDVTKGEEEIESGEEKKLLCCYIDKSKSGKNKKIGGKHKKRKRHEYERPKVVVRRMKSKEDTDDDNEKKEMESYKEKPKEEKDEKDDKDEDDKDAENDDKDEKEDAATDRESSSDKDDSDRDESSFRKHGKKVGENDEDSDRGKGEAQESGDVGEDKDERPAKHRKPPKEDDEMEPELYKHSKKGKCGGKKCNKAKYKSQKGEDDSEMNKYKEYDDQASTTGNKADEDSDKQADVYKESTDKRAYNSNSAAQVIAEFRRRAKQRSPFIRTPDNRNSTKEESTETTCLETVETIPPNGDTKEAYMPPNEEHRNVTNEESIDNAEDTGDQEKNEQENPDVDIATDSPNQPVQDRVNGPNVNQARLGGGDGGNKTEALGAMMDKNEQSMTIPSDSNKEYGETDTAAAFIQSELTTPCNRTSINYNYFNVTINMISNEASTDSSGGDEASNSDARHKPRVMVNGDGDNELRELTKNIVELVKKGKWCNNQTENQPTQMQKAGEPPSSAALKPGGTLAQQIPRNESKDISEESNIPEVAKEPEEAKDSGEGSTQSDEVQDNGGGKPEAAKDGREEIPQPEQEEDMKGNDNYGDGNETEQSEVSKDNGEGKEQEGDNNQEKGDAKGQAMESYKEKGGNVETKEKLGNGNGNGEGGKQGGENDKEKEGNGESGERGDDNDKGQKDIGEGGDQEEEHDKESGDKLKVNEKTTEEDKTSGEEAPGPDDEGPKSGDKEIDDNNNENGAPKKDLPDKKPISGIAVAGETEKVPDAQGAYKVSSEKGIEEAENENYTQTTELSSGGETLDNSTSTTLNENETTTSYESSRIEPVKSAPVLLKETPTGESEVLAEPKNGESDTKSKPILIKSSTVVHIGGKTSPQPCKNSTSTDVDDTIPQNIGQEDIKDIIKSGIISKLPISLVPRSHSTEEISEEEIQENDKRNTITKKESGHLRNQEALVENLQKIINKYRNRLKDGPTRRQAHPSVVHHHTEKKKQKSVPKDPCIAESDDYYNGQDYDPVRRDTSDLENVEVNCDNHVIKYPLISVAGSVRESLVKRDTKDTSDNENFHYKNHISKTSLSPSVSYSRNNSVKRCTTESDAIDDSEYHDDDSLKTSWFSVDRPSKDLMKKRAKELSVGDDQEYYHEKRIMKNAFIPVARPAKEAFKETESVDEELKERLLFQKVYDSVMRSRKKTHDFDIYKTVDEYFDNTPSQDEDQPVFHVDDNMDNIEIPVKRKQEYEELQKEKHEEEDVTEDTGGGLVEVLRARKKSDDPRTAKHTQKKKIASPSEDAIIDISKSTYEDSFDEPSFEMTSTEIQSKVKLDDVDSFKDVIEQPMSAIAKRSTMRRQLKHLGSGDSSYLSPVLEENNGSENIRLRRKLRYLRNQPRQTPPLNRVVPFNYNDYIQNHRQGSHYGQALERSNAQGDTANFREGQNSNVNQDNISQTTTELDVNPTPNCPQETNTENFTTGCHTTDICDEQNANTQNQSKVDEDEQKKKEREDMRNMLNGDLPMNLINIFYGKLKDNNALYNRFGGSITSSKECAFENVMNIKAFREEQAKIDIKHAEEMLHEVIVMLNRIVADQVHRKTCLKLSPNLKLFIVRITRGMRNFKKSSQIAEGYPLPKIKYRSNQEFITPPTEEEQGQLLFEDGDHGKENSVEDKSEIRKRIKLIEKLLEKYQKMSMRCQVQVEPVRNYLMDHLQMLMKMLEKSEPLSTTYANNGNLRKEPQVSEEELTPRKSNAIPLANQEEESKGECTTIEQRSIQLNKDTDSEIAHRQQVLIETQQDQKKMDEVNQLLSEQQRENEFFGPPPVHDEQHSQRDMLYKEYRRNLNTNLVKGSPLSLTANAAFQQQYAQASAPPPQVPSKPQSQSPPSPQPQVTPPRSPASTLQPQTSGQPAQGAPPPQQENSRIAAIAPPSLGPPVASILNKDLVNTTVSTANDALKTKYSYPELVTKDLMLLGLGGANTYVPPFSVTGVVKEQMIKMSNAQNNAQNNQPITPSLPPQNLANAPQNTPSLQAGFMPSSYAPPSSTQTALQLQPCIRSENRPSVDQTQSALLPQVVYREESTLSKDVSLMEKQRFKRVTIDDSEEDTNEEASSKIRQLYEVSNVNKSNLKSKNRELQEVLSSDVYTIPVFEGKRALNPYQEPLHEIFSERSSKSVRSTIPSHTFKEVKMTSKPASAKLEANTEQTLMDYQLGQIWEKSQEDLPQNTPKIVPEMLEGGTDTVIPMQNPDLIRNEVHASAPVFADVAYPITKFNLHSRPNAVPEGPRHVSQSYPVLMQKQYIPLPLSPNKSNWNGTEKYKKLMETYELLREKRQNEERLAKLFGNKDDDKLAIKTANKQMQDISKVNFEKPLVFSLD